MQTFQPIFFIPVTLIGIDFCQYVPLSVTLAVAGGHEVIANRTLAYHF